MAVTIGPDDIYAFLGTKGVSAWGVASNEPPMALAPPLPRAISMMVAYQGFALEGLTTVPSETYYEDYRRLNATLNAASTALAEHLRQQGFRAQALEATLEDYEQVKDWGDAGVFPHKTAATRAGLGWIGKTALFVSPLFGPKVRLATVFTDLDLPTGVPVDAGRCGRCRLCVDACPVGAGHDVQWRAGMPRDLLYDEKACEAYLDNFPELGGVCGVCVAACPFGKKELARIAALGA